MSGAGTSTMVAADAQFSVARVLKPFADFESAYQGEPSFRPIAFPGGRDPRAGQDGFSPDLMRGVPVPFGSRLCVYIPAAFTQTPGPTTFVQPYNYSFVWRLRNVRDYRQDRRPYHFPRQSPGAPDSTLGGGPRFVLPAAIDAVLYEQGEPAPGTRAVQRAYQQTYTVGLGYEFATLPLLPGGGAGGSYQQGVLNPADVGLVGANGAIFTALWMDAAGDELIILANRTNEALGPWDFADDATDAAFSDIYGTGDGAHPSYPDVGIYLFTGTNP